MTRRRAAVMALLGLAVTGSVGAQPRPTPARPQPAQPAATATRPYTVQAGDTCAGIAATRFRDRARTDLVHRFNPGLGPPPHRLRVGQVLQLPTRVPVERGPIPVALITQTQNRVELLQEDRTRAAQRLDPLFRGTRLSTLDRASAEVTFADETQIRLSEQTLVVILGDTNTRVRRLATARDTVLERGTLRAFLGTLAGDAPAAPATPVTPVAAVPGRPVVRRPAPARPRPVQRIALRTASGRVTLTEGESQLTVGDNNETTLAVYSGRGQIQSGTRTVTVAEGFAVRATGTGRIEAPRALPLAPRWTERPTALVLTETTALLRAAWEPGVAATGPAREAPTRWHVQVATDPSFLGLHHDSTVAGEVRSLALAEVPPGRYHVHVSALDDARFEGPFGEALEVLVVRPRVVPTARAHRATVVLPAGVLCGLDNAPLTATEAAPLEFDHLQAHTLRCALRADDPAPATLQLAAETRGPFTVVARLVDADAVARRGRVRVQVVDAAGERIGADQLTARSDAPAVRAAGLAPGDAPTLGLVDVSWSPEARDFALLLTVDGRESVDTARFVLPEAPPPPPPPPSTWRSRVSLRAEGFGAVMLPTYQTNADPNRFDGNTLAMTAGAGGALRVGFDLVHRPPGGTGGALSFGVGASGWLFPRDGGQSGRASVYTLGLRWEPRATQRLVPWVDAHFGLTFTGDVTRPALELGVGLDVRVSPRLRLGPMVRYFQIVQPASDPYPTDARVIAGGVALTWRAGP